MAVVFPEKLSLAQLPTPLVALDKISATLNGPSIWLKRDDLTGCVESGNKIRKLEYTLKHVIDGGFDSVITCGGVQSNHCRATAILAAQLGLRCDLLLRGEPSDTGNTLLDVLAGAHCQFYSVANYQKNLESLLQERVKQLKQKGFNPWVIPTGASDGFGIWGYMQAFDEIINDCKILGFSPDAICHATGSGGTQAGLTLRSAQMGFKGEVLGINVCDNAQYFAQKVRQDINHWAKLNQQSLDAITLNIQTIDGYVGKGYSKTQPEELACLQHLAQLEGIILDPVYTGKAFYGLTQEIKKGRFEGVENIVFIHTGGVFSLFAYSDELFNSHLEG